MTPTLGSLKFYAILASAFVAVGIFEIYHGIPRPQHISKKTIRSEPTPKPEQIIESIRQRASFSLDFETSNEILDVSYRLPNSLQPTAYILKLRPIFPDSLRKPAILSESVVNNLSFSNVSESVDYAPILESSEPSPDLPFTIPGQVVIYFHCREETEQIVLHSHAIAIDVDSITVRQVDDGETPDSTPPSDWFEDSRNESISITGTDYDSIQDFFTIYLAETLVPEKRYKVQITFQSQMVQHESVAIFGHFYSDNGTEKFIVATKFQATYARQAFPCFDEPSFKSIFYIVIGRSPEYHSLANAPLNYSEPDPTRSDIMWDYFQPSLKMSTYLVCFAISDFVSQSSPIESLRPVKLWAPKAYIESGGGIYATNITVHIVEFLENYFNISDSLPKIDNIVIPQFTSSAMENWGLITYKHNMVIYIPTESLEMSEYSRSLVTTVVAHELSHHWFGNLVTCEWWSDIWLNEGFATYFSFVILEKMFPEFDPHGEFITGVHQLSMTTDPMSSTNPVRNSARTKSEVENAFSRETYRKGASLVRMMRNFLTDDGLQRGLQHFMRKHAFGTANQNELYEIFNDVSSQYLPPNVTVKEIMDTWTLQSCYPLVRVAVEKPGTLRLSQEKFTLYPQERELKQDSSTWWIPIAIQSSANNDSNAAFPAYWMPPTTPTVLTNNIDTDNVVVINANAGGYFSVLYDESMLDKIADQLVQNHTYLSPVTRSQLLHDYMSLTQARYVRAASFLKLTRYIGNETEYSVWDAVIQYIRDLNLQVLASEEYHSSFLEYFLPRVDQAAKASIHRVKQRPRPKENVSDILFRSMIVTLACDLGSDLCYEVFKDTFRKWVADPETSKLPLNAEDDVLCAQVRKEGEPVWRYILNRYTNETNSQAHWWYSKALTCSSDPELIRETIKLMEKNIFREFSSTRSLAMVNLVQNSRRPKVIFKYFVENFGRNPNISPELFTFTIRSLSSYITEKDDIEQLRECLAANKDLLSVDRLQNIQDSLDIMKEKMVWVSTHGKELHNWFSQNLS